MKAINRRVFIRVASAKHVDSSNADYFVVDIPRAMADQYHRRQRRHFVIPKGMDGSQRNIGYLIEEPPRRHFTRCLWARADWCHANGIYQLGNPEKG